MSNKEIPDIGEMYEFWSMRNEISICLQRALEWDYDSADKLDREVWIATLVTKIEALGKKEGE